DGVVGADLLTLALDQWLHLERAGRLGFRNRDLGSAAPISHGRKSCSRPHQGTRRAGKLRVNQIDDENQSVTDLDAGLRVTTHWVVAVLPRHGNQDTAALVLSSQPFAEARHDLRQAEGNRLPSAERFVELLAGSPVHPVVVDLDALAC